MSFNLRNSPSAGTAGKCKEVKDGEMSKKNHTKKENPELKMREWAGVSQDEVRKYYELGQQIMKKGGSLKGKSKMSDLPGILMGMYI